MSELSSPQTIIRNLTKAAEKAADAELKKTILEAASSIKYLLRLLKECDQYIDGVKEYAEPPLFIKAVQEALEE